MDSGDGTAERRNEMICPYNGFKECNWEKCAARMYVKDISKAGGYFMKVCAIAYSGGEAPKPKKEDAL